MTDYKHVKGPVLRLQKKRSVEGRRRESGGRKFGDLIRTVKEKRNNGEIKTLLGHADVPFKCSYYRKDGRSSRPRPYVAHDSPSLFLTVGSKTKGFSEI